MAYFFICYTHSYTTFMKKNIISFRDYIKLLGLTESFNCFYKKGLRISKTTLYDLYTKDCINHK